MPRNLGTYSDDNAVPRKIDIAPACVTQASGASLEVADNTVYEYTALAETLSVNCLPVVNSVSGALLRITFASGGATTFTNHSYYDGDACDTATAGDVFEFVVFKGSVFGKKLTSRWDDAPAQGSSSAPIDFATTEQNTGLKWLDGKILYQKTFSLTSSVGNVVNLAHGVSMETALIDYSASALMTGTACVPVAYCDEGGYLCRTNIVGENIRFFTNHPSWGNCTVYITVRYTKA